MIYYRKVSFSISKGKLSDIKLDPSKKDDPLSLLNKSNTDFLKDINFLQKPETPKVEQPNPQEDKFKSFDFLSKQQARYLIEILKQPVYFDHLPKDAQELVKVINFNSASK